METFLHEGKMHFLSKNAQGCARFPKFVQNFSERQILWSLCSVDFHTFTLQLPIQTSLSVAPELQVFVSSLENMSENKSGFSFGFRILVSGFGCLLQVSVTRLI